MMDHPTRVSIGKADEDAPSWFKEELAEVIVDLQRRLTIAHQTDLGKERSRGDAARAALRDAKKGIRRMEPTSPWTPEFEADHQTEWLQDSSKETGYALTSAIASCDNDLTQIISLDPCDSHQSAPTTALYHSLQEEDAVEDHHGAVEDAVHHYLHEGRHGARAKACSTEPANTHQVPGESEGGGRQFTSLSIPKVSVTEAPAVVDQLNLPAATSNEDDESSGVSASPLRKRSSNSLFVDAGAPMQAVKSLPNTRSSNSIDVRMHGSRTSGSSSSQSLLSPPGRRQPHKQSETHIQDFELLGVWHSSATLATARSWGTSSTAMSNSIIRSGVLTEIISGDFENDASGFCSVLMMVPNHTISNSWECVGFALICFDLIVIPLAFMDLPRTVFTSTASWITKMYWTINVPISFLTGYIDKKGAVVLNSRKVAKRYLSTWFCFDIVVIFVDWGELLWQQAAEKRDFGLLQFAGAITTLRLVRIFRVARLVRLGGLITDNIRNEHVILCAQMAKLMIAMVSFTHMISCFWYGVGRIGRSDSQSWVEHQRLDRESFAKRYLMSFHCALALFTGEHVVQPQNVFERLFTVMALFLTMVISAWFVSSLTNTMTRTQIITQRNAQMFLALKRYLSDNSISRDLSVKVFRNAAHATAERKRHAPEASIELLQIISEPLRSELHFEVHSPVLFVHPFFKVYKEYFLPAVHRLCHRAVGRLTFSNGDVVFSEHEFPAEPKMYHIVLGNLSYTQKHDFSEVKSISINASHWLSEAVLWTQWTHQGTLCAVSECQVLTLDAHKFQNIVSKFPTKSVKAYAEEFIKTLRTTRRDDLTDVGHDSPELKFAIHLAFPNGHHHHRSSWGRSSPSRRSKQSTKSRASNINSYDDDPKHDSGNEESFKSEISRIGEFLQWLVRITCCRCCQREGQRENCASPFQDVASTS